MNQEYAAISWTPVSESKPEPYTTVLYLTENKAEAGFMNDSGWWLNAGGLEEEEVTHWQPIPARPEPAQKLQGCPRPKRKPRFWPRY